MFSLYTVFACIRIAKAARDGNTAWEDGLSDEWHHPRVIHHHHHHHDHIIHHQPNSQDLSAEWRQFKHQTSHPSDDESHEGAHDESTQGERESTQGEREKVEWIDHTGISVHSIGADNDEFHMQDKAGRSVEWTDRSGASVHRIGADRNDFHMQDKAGRGRFDDFDREGEDVGRRPPDAGRHTAGTPDVGRGTREREYGNHRRDPHYDESDRLGDDGNDGRPGRYYGARGRLDEDEPDPSRDRVRLKMPTVTRNRADYLPPPIRLSPEESPVPYWQPTQMMPMMPFLLPATPHDEANDALQKISGRRGQAFVPIGTESLKDNFSPVSQPMLVRMPKKGQSYDEFVPALRNDDEIFDVLSDRSGKCNFFFPGESHELTLMNFYVTLSSWMCWYDLMNAEKDEKITESEWTQFLVRHGDAFPKSAPEVHYRLFQFACRQGERESTIFRKSFGISEWVTLFILVDISADYQIQRWEWKTVVGEYGYVFKIPQQEVEKRKAANKWRVDHLRVETHINRHG